MKKYLLLSLVMIFTFSSIITGCSDLEENPETQLVQSISTRSLSFTDYYWYNGTKIGINKKTDKKFILFKTSDEIGIKSTLARLKIVDKPSKVNLSAKIKRYVCCRLADLHRERNCYQ